jgi:hypothetical protein
MKRPPIREKRIGGFDSPQDAEKQSQMGLVQNIGRAGDLFASRPFGGRDIGMYQSEDWYMQPPPAAAMLIQIPAQNEEMQPRMGLLQ